MTKLECSTPLSRNWIDPNWLLTELEYFTKLKLEAEFVSHPDSLARRPIDPAMGNSFGSYSEPGSRNNYQAETSPMIRDDDDVTPKLRQRRGEGVESHNNYNRTKQIRVA